MMDPLSNSPPGSMGIRQLGSLNSDKLSNDLLIVISLPLSNGPPGNLAVPSLNSVMVRRF